MCKLHRIPWGISFIDPGFACPGEGDPAGEQHGSIAGVPGTILVVTNQWETTAGELHTDLVTSAGVETDVYQRCCSGGLSDKLQTGFLHPVSLPLHHENLIFAAVLEQ